MATSMEAFTLRDYQSEAVEEIYNHLATNDRTLAVLPTGTGKTVIFGEVIRRWQKGRVLVVAHREELIAQACHKIELMTGDPCDVEMADFRADQCSIINRAKTVVTSVQTMSRVNRHSRFHPDEFGLCIVDEAHHAVAPTYQAVIEHFAGEHGIKVLGVTATPDRADELALGRIFQTVAYEYEILKAINSGWLVPIEQGFARIDGLDLSEVSTLAGDLNQGQLKAVVEDERVELGMAGAIIDAAGDEQTLVFTASVDQAEKIAQIINRHRKGSAAYVCGDLARCDKTERHDRLRAFSNRDIQYLVNCGVLTEGYDEPSIGMIAMARPTKSRALYAQIIGRGTRPLPGLVDGFDDPDDRRAAIAGSPKPSLFVLDFVGNAGRHHLIHTGDILGGDFDTEVIAAATQQAMGAAQGRAERVDMLAEMAAIRREREEAKARAAAHVRAKTLYAITKISPFEIFNRTAKREPGWHKGRVPTPKQVAVLDRAGIDPAQLSFHQASQLIDEIFDRRKKNLCSFKQARTLRKHGFNPEGLSFQDASAQIQRIADSCWKLHGDYYR